MKYKTFKYRLYPNHDQCVLIDKHIGSIRFIYNLSLEVKKMAYSGTKNKLSAYDISTQLPELKKHSPWLKEINAQSLQVSIQTMDKAFIDFFNGKSEIPKFKKKLSHGSFNVPQAIQIDNGLLKIPKFRDGIKMRVHREIVGVIKNVTIIKTSAHKYFACVLCEESYKDENPIVILPEHSIGVDLGIKSFIITSNGDKIQNPKFLRKNQSKIKFIQRKYSKHKGKRAKHRLTILHEKITNQRKDFLHKVSNQLISDNQTICIETLKVSNMIKNHKLALSISDAGWSTFVSMLEYKSSWNNKIILKIGSFIPSSKMCSKCNYINKDLNLGHREWVCSGCNSILDRDINAAINIKNIALKNNLSVECRLKNQVELPALAGALTLEANIGNSHKHNTK